MIKVFLLCLIWSSSYLFVGGQNPLMIIFILVLCLSAGYFYKNDKLNLTNLLLISGIGFVYLLTYSFNYDNFLSPYGDDALFLRESKNQDLSYLNIFPTFLKTLRFITDIFDFNDQDFLYVAYLSSWILYALLINLSHKVFERVVKLRINLSLYSTFLIGLYLIQWSFVHVYRDLILFYLVFLGINYLLNKKYLIVFIIMIPVFFLRGATFFSVTFACFLFRYRELLLNGSTLFIKSVKISILTFLAIILSGAFVYIVPYISRFGNIEGNDSNADIVSFLDKRTNFVESNEEIQDQVTYKIMQQSWIVKVIALPTVNIITPVKYSGLVIDNKRVSFKYQIQYLNEYFDFSNFFQISHLFVLSIFLPLLVINVKKYFNYSPESFALIIISLVFMLSISFISFVPRHRILFLIPLSAIAATRFKDYAYYKLKPFHIIILIILVFYNLMNSGII